MYIEFSLLSSDQADIIPLDRAKKYLSIQHSHDDEMISDMLEMAVIAAENYIGLSLNKKSWKMTIHSDLTNIIKLKYGPIIKIHSFKVFSCGDKELCLNESDYVLDKTHEQIIINRFYPSRKTEIIYDSGYIKLPPPILQGILEHLAKLYDFRGSDNALPVSARSLYQPYKQVRF